MLQVVMGGLAAKVLLELVKSTRLEEQRRRSVVVHIHVNRVFLILALKIKVRHC